MFFTLKELVRWLGVTVFEMWMILVTFTVFSVLAALKADGVVKMSWWTAFVPLFVCDGLNAYFCSIVFVRMYLEGVYKTAAFRAIWSASVLVLLFVFKLLLCQKIESQNNLVFSEVLAPIFILVQLIIIRACQLH